MHSNFRCVRTIVAVVVFLVGTLSSSSLLAQTTFGSIVGNAKDPSAAVVPGVAVTVTSAATGLAHEATTNPSGDFAVRNLLPGTYIVTAKLEGFKTWTASGIEVRLNQATTIDITMELGLITQFVEVTGAVPLLQTVDSTVGNVVGERLVSRLPLVARDFTQLTWLVPGAVPGGTSGAGYMIGGHNIAMSGNRPDQNSWTLDGTYNNETFFKNFGLRPSVDAIQEFNIQTHISSARYGVGGAHIDIATRSGGNAVHGSVFEFLRNDVLDANDFFRNRSGIKRPAFRQNNFGGVIGGPIWVPKLYKGRDKSFFFFNYEGLRRRRASTILGVTPTPAMLAGDFRLDTAGRPLRQIYNPFTTCGYANNPPCATDAQGNPILTREPFLNNQIDPSLFDPVSVLYTGMFYAPNPPNRFVPGDPLNLINTTPLKLTNDQYTARVDHRLSDKDNLFIRVSYQKIPTEIPLALPTRVQIRENNLRHITLSNTHVFNPTTVFEFKYGYSRDNIQFHHLDFPAPGLASILQYVPGIPLKAFGQFDFAVNFSAEGYAGVGNSAFQNGPDRNHQFIGNFMKIKGRHTFNTGADIKRTAMFHDNVWVDAAFTSDPTANPQNRGQTGHSFASLMLGLANSTNRFFGNPGLDALATNYHFYLQDDIKLSPKLTMNLGLRYEWSQWFRFRNDTMSSFDSSIGQYVWSGYNYVWGMPPNARRSLVDPDFNNFAPRFGLAYRLGDKTTIRAGYGVFFAGLMTWEASQGRGNWPYAAGETFSALNRDYPTVRYADIWPTLDISKMRPTAQHTLSRRNRWPYIQEWNFHIQRELTRDLLLEVGYVGTQGTKLGTFVSANDPRPGPGIVGCPQRTSCGGGPEHPRPYTNLDAVSESMNLNNSRYHGLQTKLERRFSAGLSFLTSYTWSHSIDLASNYGGDTPQDYYNRKAGYGSSSFDVRHVFVSSFVYELPFGPGRRFLKASGPAGKLLGGWDVGGIVRLNTGYPYGLSLAFDNANVGSRFVSQRPDWTGQDPYLPTSERKPERWFNTDAFAVPARYTFGNWGRNMMFGPGLKNLDISLYKTTRIHEDHAIEFRAEIFNAFNNVNFMNPGGTLGTGGYGRISSVRVPSREIQFALKYIF